MIFGKLFKKDSDLNEISGAESENLVEAYNLIMRHAGAPSLDVETSVDPETFEKLQKHVEDTWSRLGEDDAHWSVITDDRFRHSTLRSHIDEFFKMGESDVARLEMALDRIGVSLSNIESAMDFGCGVGRLSIPLARRVNHVLGVDISAAHLREAQANIDEFGLNNIEVTQTQSIDDLRRLNKVELIISMITLQHNAPPVILEILDALCSRVEAGGYLYVQSQTYSVGYKYRASEHLDNKTNEMEMHVVPQHIFLGAIQEAGFTIMEVMEDGSAWNLDYQSQVVLARKR